MASLAFTPANVARRAPAALQGETLAELIGNTIEALIALLDALGGDPDAEEDDPHGQCDEDGINTLFPIGRGAGCFIADGGV